MKPEHEKLRRSIFYSVFKNCVIIDDIDSANKFRLFLKSKKQNIPTIFVKEDKSKIRSEGIRDPNIGSGKLPNTLDFVFGQLPDNCTKEYMDLEKSNQLYQSKFNIN